MLRPLACALLFAVFCVAQTPVDGAASYASRCAVCHGDDGKGTATVPGIVSALPRATDAQLRALIRNGTESGMPGQDLPEAEMTALIAHLRAMQTPAARKASSRRGEGD